MREQTTDRSQAGEPRRGRPRREPPLPARLAGRGRATGLLLTALLAVALVVVIVAALAQLMPSLHLPFTTRRIDRSQPVLLESIQDLSVYKAATGNFQVVVDLEKENPPLPSLIKGERTLFVAAGSVDAEVDFSGLAKDAVKVSPDRKSVTLSLPHARLSRAFVDPDRSYVFSRSRGLLDRLGGILSDNPTSERELYQLSEQKLGEAAQQTALVDRAEQNTRAMLVSMLRSLGFSNVTVNFDRPPKT